MVPDPRLRARVPRADVEDKGRSIAIEGVGVFLTEKVEGHLLVLQGVEVVALGARAAVAGLFGSGYMGGDGDGGSAAVAGLLGGGGV